MQSKFSCALTAAVVTAVFTVPSTLLAQASNHLATPSALQQAAANASQARRQNAEALQKFLSSPEAQKALDSARMNPREVNKAVSGLSDQELAQVAERANKAQSDFAAGTLSDRDLLIIIVAIAALILIIVAVR